MPTIPQCNRAEHSFGRREFLAGLAGGAGALGFGALVNPAVATQVKAAERRVLVVYLNGGLSQLESWDPKPGASNGGPFRAIPTSVPGVHISELLPHTAGQMHRLALVRGINTRENSHGKGRTIMLTGRPEERGQLYPHMGAIVARQCNPSGSPLPGHLHVAPSDYRGRTENDAAFLGPRYASVVLADGQPPANLARPAGMTEPADKLRQELRAKIDGHFQARRRSAETDVYTQSFDQARQLAERSEVFDLGKETPAVADRYGRHEFGRHCLLARRLLERGATFVKLTHSNYDTHHENFDFHIEQLGEFDRSFATLIDDLHQRGLLASTLVVVMSEFGRTPIINVRDGRDHWGTAWSVCLGGCGIQGGAVVGKTNANGTAVTDREVNGAHLFHTYFRALGIDPTRNLYTPEGRPLTIADTKASAITELLA
jgi:hypothetical protein